MLNVSSISYERSESGLFQGNIREKTKKEKAGFCEVAGGNGSYIMSKPARVLLSYTDSKGEPKVVNIKDQVKYYFGGTRVTEKKVRDLEELFHEGKVEFVQDPSGYITIEDC